MPIAPRRMDAQPRQEWFEDGTGDITLEIGFHPEHGYFTREIWNHDERTTRGQNTAIVIEKLSRERVVQLQLKIALGLQAAYQSDGEFLRQQIEGLIEALRDEVTSLISDPTNLNRVHQAKDPLNAIGVQLERRRSEALASQRNVVLGVLLEDEQLKQLG